MDTLIEAKIPFLLLKRCDSKNQYDPRIDDDYFKYNHHFDCRCHGSNLVPTSLGYAILVFMKWAFHHHAWYLGGVHGKGPVTMKNVLDWADEQSLQQNKRAIERQKKWHELRDSTTDVEGENP